MGDIAKVKTTTVTTTDTKKVTPQTKEQPSAKDIKIYGNNEQTEVNKNQDSVEITTRSENSTDIDVDAPDNAYDNKE